MTPTPFLERSRYYMAVEYPAKIRSAVEAIDEDALWRRSDEESNSIGNLLLHLAGNIRQWIVAGIGGAASDRDRAAEFAARGGYGKDQLLGLLDGAVRDADAVLATLDDSDLERSLEIQGRETTALAAIYHVVEHFAMHTGQIILLAKMYAPGRVHFYEDSGGLAIPVWGGTEGLRIQD
jgi:uncharacterized damage-inducible protein DinB